MRSGTLKVAVIGTLLKLSIASSEIFLGALDTSGCDASKSHASGWSPPEDPSNQINSSNVPRQYGMYVPPDYDPIVQHSLIIDFHGKGGTPAGQYNNSMYWAHPEGQNYLVAYPAGIDHAWQGAPYANHSINDLQFTTDLLAQLRQQYCIDPTRIYASGKSNGGGFVDSLACSSNGDAFAAFAMAAPALYPDLNNTNASCPAGHRPRKILQAHGGSDPRIHYNGGKSHNETTPSIPEWVWWWAQRDGCTDEQIPTQFGGFAYVSYTCKDVPKVVQHYKVNRVGHCWPQSDRTGLNTDYKRGEADDEPCGPFTLDFTDKVVEFFKFRHL